MPNPMKSQLKMAVLQDVGVAMDDILEAATKDVYRAEGAKRWLEDASQGLKSIMEHVDKDFDEGKIADGWGAMEVRTYVKKKLSMVSQSVHDLALRAEATRLTAEGRVDSAKRCVTATKKKYDVERGKLERELDRLDPESSEGSEHVGGEARPRSTDAAKDLAERKAQAKSEKASRAKESEQKSSHNPTAYKSRSEKREQSEVRSSSTKKKSTAKKKSSRGK